MILTFLYKLIPTQRQKHQLDDLLNDQRVLYNAALEERISCYTHTKQSRTYFDQCKSLTEWRQSEPKAALVCRAVVSPEVGNVIQWDERRLENRFLKGIYK